MTIRDSLGVPLEPNYEEPILKNIPLASKESQGNKLSFYILPQKGMNRKC